MQAIHSPGDAGPSFASHFLVYVVCRNSTGIYGSFDLYQKHVLWLFCFSFLFKAASEVLKLKAQLRFRIFFGCMEVTLFNIQFLNHWFLPCCNEQDLVT